MFPLIILLHMTRRSSTVECLPNQVIWVIKSIHDNAFSHPLPSPGDPMVYKHTTVPVTKLRIFPDIQWTHICQTIIYFIITFFLEYSLYHIPKYSYNIIYLDMDLYYHSICVIWIRYFIILVILLLLPYSSGTMLCFFIGHTDIVMFQLLFY